MLTIKAKKGKHGEIRRASFKTPATFAEFINIFRESFGPLPEDYKLKFEDDEGDLVVLSNQSDYEEALRVVANSEPQILRITIVSKHEHKEKEASAPKANNPHCAPRGCPAFAGGCGVPAGGNPLGPLAALLEMGKASLPDLLKNPALRSMAEGLMHSNMVKVVQPYVCDACNANISGDRFNSTVDPNFDLCKACMESPKGAELETKYKFKRVSALEALVETLTNGGSFDAFFAPGRADEPEPVARHHAICDVCNQGIVGIRHKCLDCADYDECNVCHLRPAPHVSGHVFHPIQDPAQRTVPAEVMEAHKAKRAAAEEEAKRAAAAAAAAAAEAEAKARKEAEEAEAKARAAAEEAAKARAEAEAKSKALLTKLVPVEPKKTEDAKPVAAAPAVPVPEDKEPSAFERNLTTLESMGFSDRKRNIQVLVRNRNRLFESIQELLQ